MEQHKPTRVPRWIRLIVFRLVPLLLIAACVWQGAQTVALAVRKIDEQTQTESRRPAYQATATALEVNRPTATVAPTITITPTPRVEIPSIRLVKADSSYARQDFSTNTPSAPEATGSAQMAQPTATAPVIAETATLRPLPTFPAQWLNDTTAPGAAAPTGIPSQVPAIDRQYNLINILLMGNDQEITADGTLRTDTMIVVSINRDVGTVSMISLPRDLYVYIPGWTMQRLNLAYFHGESSGWTDGGFGLLRQTIFYNLGINIHYFAMVDLEGFRTIVDLVGGVDVAVDCAIQDLPLVDTEIPSAAVRVTEDGEYALPVGYYHMSGAEALWYARSRGSSSDFDRGRRQQQILRAIWRRARDNGLISSLPTLWSEGQQFLQTNLTLEDLLPLIPLASSLNPGQIESYTFHRIYHTTPWTPPDGANVQLPNPDAVHELMTEFYNPPTTSQLVSEGAVVRVYNGTNIPNLDLVAVDRLNWEGIAAVAMGTADRSDYTDTSVIDYTGRTKGSSLGTIVENLNILPENVVIQPSTLREADFDVILGANYNSCSESGVLPVQLPAGS
ncbi:MAG: LCP family protein [Anaerolineae bacterium]